MSLPPSLVRTGFQPDATCSSRRGEHEAPRRIDDEAEADEFGLHQALVGFRSHGNGRGEPEAGISWRWQVGHRCATTL